MNGLIKIKRTRLMPMSVLNEVTPKVVFPLDEVLGINYLPFRMTKKVMLTIAKVAISTRCYSDAYDFLLGMGINVSISEIRHVTDYIGWIIEEYLKNNYKEYSKYCGNSKHYLDYGNPNGDILFVSVDGSFLNIRDKEKTAENQSNWSEVKLAVCWKNKDTEIKSEKFGTGITGLLDRKRILVKDSIGTLDNVFDFRQRLIHLLMRNGLADCSKLVIISDGAKWIYNLKDDIFFDAECILDLFHVKERIGTYIKNAYVNDLDVAEEFISARISKLCSLAEEGYGDIVVKELNQLKDKITSLEVKNTPSYIMNAFNQGRMDYPRFLKEYGFIGSKAVESANKTVVQSRLKGSGMRWKKVHAQRILSLTSYSECNKWHIVEKIVQETDLTQLKHNKTCNL